MAFVENNAVPVNACYLVKCGTCGKTTWKVRPPCLEIVSPCPASSTPTIYPLSMLKSGRLFYDSHSSNALFSLLDHSTQALRITISEPLFDGLSSS